MLSIGGVREGVYTGGEEGIYFAVIDVADGALRLLAMPSHAFPFTTLPMLTWGLSLWKAVAYVLHALTYLAPPANARLDCTGLRCC